MKKFRLFLLPLFMILLLTGCGSSEKTLTCTNSEESSGLKTTNTVVMKFKKDKVNYVKMSVDNVAIEDGIKKSWDSIVSILDTSTNSIEEKDGIKVTSSNDAKKYKYKLSIEIDLNKASEEDLSTIGFSGVADSNSTYADTKKAAEKDGYTCK